MKKLLVAIVLTIGSLLTATGLAKIVFLIAESKYQFQSLLAIVFPLIVYAFYITIKEESKTEN